MRVTRDTRGIGERLLALGSLLLVLALLIVLGWTVSRWFAVLAAPARAAEVPSQAVRTETDSIQDARGNEVVIAARLFGVRADPSPEAKPDAPEPPPPTITLVGVMASQGGGVSYAVLAYDQGGNRLVKEGARIAPGIALLKVARDHVVISHAGGRRTRVAFAHADLADKVDRADRADGNLRASAAVAGPSPRGTTR